MFPQFASTSSGFSKASSMVFRIGTDAHLYDDPDDVSIAPLLDSKYEVEKAEGLKRLLALIAQGSDVSNFFPQVVKAMACQSLEVKKLIYVYLLHYAEKRPDEALLSINIFQKDLSDLNPLVRAWALRAMTGIQLHVVAPLVLAAVVKCARDPSTYVRKCAANALPKLYDLQQEQCSSTLEELISILINDNFPAVVGAAAASFKYICPNDFRLIGKHFGRLCEVLLDMEEWGQIVLIDILLRYAVARYGLPRRLVMVSSMPNGSPDDEEHEAISWSDHGSLAGLPDDPVLMASLFSSYVEGQDEFLLGSTTMSKVPSSLVTDESLSEGSNEVNLLLQSTSPLLWNQNSAVVLAAANVHWVMAPVENVKKIVDPILFLLRSANFSQYVVLRNVIIMARAMPSLFAPQYKYFFICSSDSYDIRALKLEILSVIADSSSIAIILQEFQDYVKDPDRKFVSDTVNVIGTCAKRIPSIADACLEGLLALVRQESSVDVKDMEEADAVVSAHAVMSIKNIIKEEPGKYEKVIISLARSLDLIRVHAARALIIWMLGEYCMIGQKIPKVIHIILQYLAQCFASENFETKIQILSATAKVVICSQAEDMQTCVKVLVYVLNMGSSDMNYDVRDRAHMLRELLACQPSVVSIGHEAFSARPNLKLLNDLPDHIFGRKLKSLTRPPVRCRFYLLGSLSLIVEHAAPGYESLPKPCSLSNIDFDQSGITDLAVNLAGNTASEDSSDSDPDKLSGSSSEETELVYSSQQTGSGSDVDETVNSIDKANHTDESSRGPLVHLLDVDAGASNLDSSNYSNHAPSICMNLSELMSKEAFESWLDQRPSSLGTKPVHGSLTSYSARIVIKETDVRIRPKIHKFLERNSETGLSVDYSFSAEVSDVSSSLVCVEVLFRNSSEKQLTKIKIVDEESLSGSHDKISGAVSLSTSREGRLSCNEEIPCLDPLSNFRQVLHVHFHHHLLPLKLALYCEGKKYPVKLSPDIGYFLKPLSLDLKAFVEKESQLPGMFEYTRRCVFSGHIDDLHPEKHDGSLDNDRILILARRLASDILSNSNVSLVSVDMPISIADDHARDAGEVSGLCLRFCAAILSNSMPCLLSVTVEGRCLEPLTIILKVNCEDTMFGLNFLNRIAAVFS